MIFLEKIIPRKPRVALVDLTGVIGGSLKPQPYVDLLLGLRETNWAQSVMLNIDSPGGTTWGSDHLRMGVQRLAEEKPVVAFISGLGASGGYMVAGAAQKIIASPAALVGSIGVISYHPLAHELFQRIGIDFEVTKSTKLKDMGAFYRESTEEEREKSQALVDEYHESFVQTVAKDRSLALEDAHNLATGEVFTGNRAVELKLVDEVGDFEYAKEVAANLGNVPHGQVTRSNPPRSLRELFAGSLAQTSALSDAQVLLSNQVLYLAPSFAQGSLLKLLK